MQVLDKVIAFDERERILFLPLCAGSTGWMPCAFEQFSSGCTIASTSCATVNNQVRCELIHILTYIQCMSFVSDFLRFNCKETRVENTYYDIRKLCNDVFCRKETLPKRFALVSMPTPLPVTPNSVSSRGFFQHAELQPRFLFIVYGEMYGGPKVPRHNRQLDGTTAKSFSFSTKTLQKLIHQVAQFFLKNNHQASII